MNRVSALDIVNYYDQCEIDYRWVWHLRNQNAMHYGYWDSNTRNLRHALDNMNVFVTNQLNVKNGQKILDAGCGVGGTSIFLSKRYNIEVYGITLSQKQVSKATDSAKGLPLKGSLQFSAQNYCQTNFQNAYFDSIYGLESVCHAEEKADFLKESHRVLKENGTLVVAGFFASKQFTKTSEVKLMENWANSWAVPAFEEINSFIHKAEKIGYELIQNDNITKNIIKSSERLYVMFYPGIVAHSVLKFFQIRNKVQEKNVWSTFYQYKSLKKELWEYRVLKFTKKQL